MWDPGTYLRYGDERGRPYGDLLARVGAREPRVVVDLGCGPGNLTATLPQRWPDARIKGLDSSPEMVAQARLLGAPVVFVRGDVRDWKPEPDVDVVVSNALLQWVPRHEELLVRWVGELNDGALLAFQVPGNFDAPSHQELRKIASDPRWVDRLPDAVAPRSVLDPEEYAALLTEQGCAVDAWETTYLHILPAGEGPHPVLTWMEGTALRPVRRALSDPEWTEFRDRLAARLAKVYSTRGDKVFFPFRRIFVVAHRGL